MIPIHQKPLFRHVRLKSQLVPLATGLFFGCFVLVAMACSGGVGASNAGAPPDGPKKPLPVADPITVKVAVVIQDPRVPSAGNKRLHEVFKTPGYTFTWHDPQQLMEAYRDTLNSVSGGAVQYEIVKVIDDGLFFTRFKDADTLMTKEDVFTYLADPNWETFREKGTTFDYAALIDHYGFCDMRDRGEIHEVWVWTFPYAGMWESTYAGKGAFWLNSNPVEGTPCVDLLTVMGLNYEREMSLAMESYGHRFESVMRKVYGRWDNHADDKNNWELFTTIDSISKGHAHIGNIHFPPNGTADYDWRNTTTVTTFADSWAYYPNLVEENPRQVDCQEWECSHLGYMCWWYRHIPNFEGINEADGHLNNWWHYVVDYNDALKLEDQLRNESK